MDLHRSSKRPDWARVGRRRRNAWQRLAKKTDGIVTIGNAVTVIGLLIVLSGLMLVLQGHYGYGLLLIVGGRVCDLLDGWLADHTGTKSPLGEIVDAGADKIETLAAAIILVAAGLLPLWLSLVVIVVQSLIAVISRIAWSRGRPVHPSRLGKLSMAGAWLGLGLFVVPVGLGLGGSAERVIIAMAYGTSLLMLAISLYVAFDYWRQQSKNQNST